MAKKSLLKIVLCNKGLRLFYAILVPFSLSVFVDLYESLWKGHTDTELTGVVNKKFDLRQG